MAWSAGLATAADFVLFRKGRQPSRHDWVYMAGGALLVGFTAHVWYPIAGLPVVDGLNVVQAIVGGIVGSVALELFYRLYVLRRRLT